MATASTKSRRKQERKLARHNEREQDSPEVLTNRNWRIASAAILIVGAFLRLYDLGLVPLHHDEGVNGNFLTSLVRQGNYQYDPQNYHGPSLYYFAAIIPWICRFIGGVGFGDAHGLTTFNIRLVTAAFGVGTIGLVLLLRNRLGTIGALSGAGLLAISPGAVYLSRYFIHEPLFVFFALGIVVAALKYYDTARPVYLILTAVSAALMVATKETWIINGPVLLIALATTSLYLRFGRGKSKRIILGIAGLVAGGLFGFLFRPSAETEQLSLTAVITRGSYPANMDAAAISVAQQSFNYVIAGALLGAAVGFIIGYLSSKDELIQPATPEPDASVAPPGWLEQAGGWVGLATYALVAFSIFIMIGVLLYSSFFTNYPKGVHDAFSTLTQWSHRTREHVHPGWQYLEWLRQEETAILILGVAGILISIWRSNNRIALFFSICSIGLLGAYSLIGYKTPWISLNFIVPLAIVSGYTLDQVHKRFAEPVVPLALTTAAVAFLIFARLVKFGGSGTDAGSGLTFNFELSRDWFIVIAILSLAVYAGYILYSRSDWEKKSAHFYVAAVLAVVVGGYQMIALNFYHYDDDKYAYVYAHTRRETLDLVNEIDRNAKRLGTGSETGIAIVSSDYWPLPWYFRDYKHALFYGRFVSSDEPIVIGSAAEEEKLDATFGSRYQLAGRYSLRPGVDLLLYLKRDQGRASDPPFSPAGPIDRGRPGAID